MTLMCVEEIDAAWRAASADSLWLIRQQAKLLAIMEEVYADAFTQNPVGNISYAHLLTEARARLEGE